MAFEEIKKILGDSIRESEVVSKRVEEAFMKTSDSLGAVVECSQTMISDSDQVIEMAIGSSGHDCDFGGTIERVYEFLNDLQKRTSMLQNEVERIEKTSVAVNDVVELEKKLMATLEPLRTMRTFFLIESSKLSESDNRAFLSLVDNIQGLYEEAQNITNQEFARFQKHNSNLEKDSVEIRNRLSQFQDKIEKEFRTLTDIFDEIQRDLAGNRNVKVELVQISQSISTTVSEMVTAIQNQDICSQKFVHTFDTIQQILDKLGEWDRGRYDMVQQADIPQFVVNAAKIQREHILSILEDYKRSSEVISDACPRIFADVERIDEDCLMLREYKTLTTSADGVIQILLESLETVDTLLGGFRDLVDFSNHSLAPLEEINAKVTRVLDNITTDLRVVTINARIKAHKQNQRSGLNPLTENVGSISSETQSISHVLGDKLEWTVVQIEEMLKHLSSYHDQCDTITNEFQSFENGANQRLHAFRDEALEKLNKLVADGEQVGGIAESLLQSKDNSFIDEPFYLGVIQSLDQLVEEVEAFCGDQVDFSDIATEELKSMGKKYTMAQEWENQQKALGDDVDISFDQESAGVEDDEVIFF